MSDLIQRGAEELKQRLCAAPVVAEPYPHILIDPAIDWDVYERLEASFPASAVVYAGERPRNNRAYLLDAVDTLNHPDIDPDWREMFAHLASPDFFRSALTAVTPHTRRLFPDIEERLGKRLEECSFAIRHGGEEADFYFDVQIGVNSPVMRRSRVRAIHVDSTAKIFNALLYMRPVDDTVDGGALGMYGWQGERRYTRVSVAENDAFQVSTVPYARNRMLLFHNSPDSLHGVTPRAKTPIVRRYINFLLEARVPVFDLSAYQVAPSLSRRVEKIWQKVAG